MQYPKWLINFICCFVPKKKNREHLRKKYIKPSVMDCLQVVETNLSQMQEKLLAIETNFLQKIDSVSQKNDNNSQKFDAISQKNDAISQKFDVISQKNDAISQKFDVIYPQILQQTSSDYTSYAQFGEDRVVAGVLYYLFDKIPSKITYLDIGSNYPDRDSNTYYFYQKEGNGVLIEPNPIFKTQITNLRPRDVLLNCGISITDEKEATYYSFEIHGWNTFSKERAEEICAENPEQAKTMQTLTLPLVKIDDVLNEHFSGRVLDILSIDVEGIDFEILSSIDYSKYRPKIIVFEANRKDISYGYKNNVMEFMESKSYALVADTFINMIFADTTQMNPNFKGIFYNKQELVRSSSSVVFEQFYKRPCSLKIEVTNLCNARCKFCIYKDIKVDKYDFMDMELFTKVIDDYAAIGGGSIVISPVVGEALLNKNIPEFLKIIKENPKLADVGLHTNLLELKNYPQEKIDTILSSTDWINVSAGANAEDYRLAYGVDKFESFIAGVQIIVEFYKRTGIIPRLEFHGRSLEYQPEVDPRLLDAIAQLPNARIEWIQSYNDWGGAIQDFGQEQQIIKANSNVCRTRPCAIPLRFAVVYANGDVGYCSCADAKKTMLLGSIFKHSLGELLNSSKRKKLINNYENPPAFCKECTFYEPLASKEEESWTFNRDPFLQLTI